MIDNDKRNLNTLQRQEPELAQTIRRLFNRLSADSASEKGFP
jgi:flagellar basal body-associated protein FliL